MQKPKQRVNIYLNDELWAWYEKLPKMKRSQIISDILMRGAEIEAQPIQSEKLEDRFKQQEAELVKLKNLIDRRIDGIYNHFTPRLVVLQRKLDIEPDPMSGEFEAPTDPQSFGEKQSLRRQEIQALFSQPATGTILDNKN